MNKLIVTAIPEIDTLYGSKALTSRLTVPCVIAQTQYGSVNSIHCVPSSTFAGDIDIKVYVSNKPEDDLSVVPPHAVLLTGKDGNIVDDSPVLIDGITTACSLLFYEFSGTHTAGEVEVWINSHSLF